MRFLRELPAEPMPMWERIVCAFVLIVLSPIWAPALLITGLFFAVASLFSKPSDR